MDVLWGLEHDGLINLCSKFETERLNIFLNKNIITKIFNGGCTDKEGDF